jgi:hypothetical protein
MSLRSEKLRIQGWVKRKTEELRERRLMLAEHNRRENAELNKINRMIFQADEVIRKSTKH